MKHKSDGIMPAADRIVVVGAACERCGLEDDAGYATTTYLERHNGDRFVTICKDMRACTERQAERIRDEVLLPVERETWKGQRVVREQFDKWYDAFGGTDKISEYTHQGKAWQGYQAGWAAGQAARRQTSGGESGAAASRAPS